MMRDQNSRTPRPHRQRLALIPILSQLVLFTLAMALAALTAHAQATPGVGSTTGRGCRTGSEKDCYVPPLMPDIPPFLKPAAANDEKCLPWNLSAVRASTVSAPALKVSSKARSEYEKA